MVEDGPLARGIERPSGRIVRRVDHQRARARSEHRDQLFDVERPAARPEREVLTHDVGPENFRNFGQIGP